MRTKHCWFLVMIFAIHLADKDFPKRFLTAGSGNPLMVIGIEGHRDWSTEMFDCFDDLKLCLLGFFCLPCTVCSVASRTRECCCMPYCVQGGTVVLRSRIRTIGGIQGTACMDCVILSLLGPCAVCQMQRELDNMGVPK